MDSIKIKKRETYIDDTAELTLFDLYINDRCHYTFTTDEVHSLLEQLKERLK